MEKKILVVDDSATVRQAIGLHLEKAGYRNISANDGLEALDKIATESVDMIITDINMPRLDGFELIKQARQLPKTKYIPIIVLTTESSDEVKMKGKAAGATGWIVKPFKADHLLKVIKMTIG